MEGILTQKIDIVGEIFSKVELVGELSDSQTLIGDLSIPTMADYDSYQGEYEVTPAVEKQELETKNKKMDENLTIKEIPFYEVSNTKGTTIIIGGI